MPALKSHRIVQGDHEYELELGLDDAAIMQEAVRFEITARSRHRAEDHWNEHKASVDLDFEGERPVARVTIEGHDPIEIDLGMVDISPGASFEDAWEAIRDACEGSAFEQLVMAFPADPVIGCLLKAGISTSIGQAIGCYRETEHAKGLRTRVRRTLSCLGENLPGMLFTATARTLKCMVMLGFG